MTRPGSRGCIVSVLLYVWLAGTGCKLGEMTGSTRYVLDSPVAVLQNSERSLDGRIAAANELVASRDSDWFALSAVAWSSREPVRLRLSLMARLRASDVERFWSDAGVYWPSERSEPVDAYLRGAVGGAGETAAAAVLLRWSEMRTSVSHRSEFIETWNAALGVESEHADAEMATENLLACLASARPWAWRVAAWRVVSAWMDPALLEAWLIARHDAGESSDLLMDLRATVGVMRQWPVHGWELYALRGLRTRVDPDGGTAWLTLRERAMQLEPQARQDLAMRHMAWLLASPETLGFKPIGNAGEQSGRNVMDSRVVSWLETALQNQRLVGEVFSQADADHADPQSEHGGLVKLDPHGAAVFESYAPAERRHDRAYLAPASLSLNLGDAVATYHFHAERYANAESAGPGSGDRRSVERSATLMVVLTFLDRDTLAVHVAAPGNQLFDLGVVRRP